GIIGAIPRPSLGIEDIFSYREENQVLRQRLMQYTLLNAELADYARENEHLRRMLRFTENSAYDLRLAEVTNRGASSILSTVALNIGTRHGIEPNLPVLTLAGLLGKTMTVAPNASVVQLATDRNFRLSVKVGDEGVRGILAPSYGLYAEVTGILPGSSVQPGDRVMTSGFSDIYPKNLPVGVVEEVEVIPGDNFSHVKVLLHADPSETEHVFVLVRRDTGS
ncbi:MAG: rod shape-determining protein MreC, partial [Candidatus Neomarinimicrobiota bacterium]